MKTEYGVIVLWGVRMGHSGRPFGRWLPAPGFEAGYEVSDDGRIWSARTQRILRGSPMKGYLNVRFTRDGAYYARPIHRLVCEAFHGPCPADKEMVGHLDGNRQNNRVDNLAWITRSENTFHSIAHGTFMGKPRPAKPGSAHHAAKLNEAQVAEILASDLGHTALARHYGVSETQIRRIRSGKKWASVDRSCASQAKPLIGRRGAWQ